MSNPARADGLYPVLMSPELFESLNRPGERFTVTMGEPDEDGFYTPTVYTHVVEDDPHYSQHEPTVTLA